MVVVVVSNQLHPMQNVQKGMRNVKRRIKMKFKDKRGLKLMFEKEGERVKGFFL